MRNALRANARLLCLSLLLSAMAAALVFSVPAPVQAHQASGTDYTITYYQANGQFCGLYIRNCDGHTSLLGSTTPYSVFEDFPDC